MKWDIEVERVTKQNNLTHEDAVNRQVRQKATDNQQPVYRGHSQWRTQEFFSGGGSTNSAEDRGQRGWGSGGGSPLVRGSGGSCNLIQEISFHIVTFS